MNGSVGKMFEGVAHNKSSLGVFITFNFMTDVHYLNVGAFTIKQTLYGPNVKIVVGPIAG
jgi:hypothetical protein